MFTLGRKRKISDTTLQGEKNEKSLMDLPTEVIEKNLLVYLVNNDIRSFSKTGNKRFEQISKAVLEKRGNPY